MPGSIGPSARRSTHLERIYFAADERPSSVLARTRPFVLVLRIPYRKESSGEGENDVNAFSPFGRLAGFTPLIVRLIVGVIMAAHGLQKLAMGPTGFGQGMLAQLSVPAPVLMGYVVTFVELVGGILLIAGLFARLAALLLTII
jgi:hypothetical protein